MIVNLFTNEIDPGEYTGTYIVSHKTLPEPRLASEFKRDWSVELGRQKAAKEDWSVEDIIDAMEDDGWFFDPVMPLNAYY